jgi:antitoxin component of MazEF toxin-antitoxin module
VYTFCGKTKGVRMSKKLTRHGNSLALIIDKPLLRLLNISEKTNLELLIEDGALVIRPTQKKSKRSKSEIKKIAQEIMDEYADVFQKLAK